jgi:hypothetical protein
MSTGFVMILLFVLSEVAGVLIGEWFFHLFMKAMPPVALSQVISQSSHFFFWLYGGGVGVVLFLWTLLGMTVSKMQQAMKPKS